MQFGHGASLLPLSSASSAVDDFGFCLRLNIPLGMSNLVQSVSFNTQKTVRHYLEKMEVRDILFMIVLTVICGVWVYEFKQYFLGSIELKAFDAIANYSKSDELLYQSFQCCFGVDFTL